MLKSINSFVTKFGRDETGVTMLEYTILIGIITVASITAVTALGTWVGIKWTTLKAAVGA